jgi:hypothetical protein
MWTCPNCGRKFKNAHQNHSCKLISKDGLFDKRAPELKTIYQKILAIVRKFGEFRVETIPPDTIFFKTISTFLAVKVKKAHLEVEFFLDHYEDDPSVSKFLQTSKHRYVHVVPVDREANIDKQLMAWMKSSYELVLKK